MDREMLPDATTTEERHLEGRVVYSVSGINRRIADILQTDRLLRDVWIEGEVSGFKPHLPSGHYYLTLKDATSQISCAVFRNAAASIPELRGLKDGTLVLARGDIGHYAPRGTYTFRIRELRCKGRGDLYRLFEEMTRSLEKEGLFDEARKRSLPPFPRSIGVVTSESGAAFQDILNILGRRMPLTRVVLSPAVVQGADAAASITASLRRLDASGRVDLIILGRGGGSMEDLWCFNDEGLARAIAASRTPVISAVGHAIDFTIADFVADVRAPTPSAAAEIAVPDMAGILRQLRESQDHLISVMRSMIRSGREDLISLEERLSSRRPMTFIEQGHRRCDELEERITNTLRTTLLSLRKDIEGWEERLESSSLTSMLHRGFAVVTGPEGNIITGIAGIGENMNITIDVSDGRISATTTGVQKHDR